MNSYLKNIIKFSVIFIIGYILGCIYPIISLSDQDLGDTDQEQQEPLAFANNTAVEIEAI